MQMRIRPSRAHSVMGMIFSLAAVAAGIFVVLPANGFFGITFVLLALLAFAYHTWNALTKEGIPHEIIETDMRSSANATEQRLADLAELRRRGVITEQEEARRREAIINEL